MIPADYQRVSVTALGTRTATLSLPTDYSVTGQIRPVALELAHTLGEHAAHLARAGMVHDIAALNAGKPYGAYGAWRTYYTPAAGGMSHGPILTSGYDSSRELVAALRASNATFSRMFEYSRANIRHGHTYGAWFRVAAITRHLSAGRISGARAAIIRNELAYVGACYSADDPTAGRILAAWQAPNARLVAMTLQLAATETTRIYNDGK